MGYTVYEYDLLGENEYILFIAMLNCRRAIERRQLELHTSLQFRSEWKMFLTARRSRSGGGRFHSQKEIMK